MELHDPIAAYNAATNVEAHLVKMMLIEAGIDAFVSEDLSIVGLWIFGTLPEIHKPQVWISARDAERAQAVLAKYEQHLAERVQPPAPEGEKEIEVVCEECNEKSSFPSSQRGTIQYCPHCAAHVDVGDSEDDPYWHGGGSSTT